MKYNILYYLILSLLFFQNCSSQQEERYWQKLIDGLDFPEGPAWDGENTLYVSNCYGNWMPRIRDNRVETFLEAKIKKTVNFKNTNGLTVGKDRYIYACDFGQGKILRISPKGEVHQYVEEYEGQPLVNPNDLAFGPHGNLYFTDPGKYDTTQYQGRIFRVNSADQELTLLDTGLAFSNGIAFSLDGQSLLVCESMKHRILKYALDEDGLLGEPVVFVALPGGEPDGIAFDIKGNLYVAHFGGGAIYVISPEGEVIDKIATPGSKPSNVEFGGKDMKTLFITEDETNAVYATKVDIPGSLLLWSPNSK